MALCQSFGNQVKASYYEAFGVIEISYSLIMNLVSASLGIPFASRFWSHGRAEFNNALFFF
jgi:hypothetical protein